jgi:hypothetical protein
VRHLRVQFGNPGQVVGLEDTTADETLSQLHVGLGEKAQGGRRGSLKG